MTTRTIEVYATDPAGAEGAARAYARDDMGCAITDITSIERTFGPWAGRYIWKVTGILQRLVGDASDPAEPAYDSDGNLQ